MSYPEKLSGSLVRQSSRLSSLLLCLALTAAVTGCGEKEEMPKATPIQQARALALGESAIIEGAVSVPPGAFASAMGDEGFALQDASGGIYVKLAQKLEFGLSARVRVLGTLNEQNKLIILDTQPAEVSRLEGTELVLPRQTRTGDVNESAEGLLVRVTGNVTQPFVDDSPYGYKFFINDGSGEIQIFAHTSAGFDKAPLQALTVGQRVTVVGLAAQYETTYEVAPRQPSDLTTP